MKKERWEEEKGNTGEREHGEGKQRGQCGKKGCRKRKGAGGKKSGEAKGDNERGEGERRGIVKKEKNVKGEQEGTMRER